MFFGECIFGSLDICECIYWVSNQEDQQFEKKNVGHVGLHSCIKGRVGLGT